MNSYGQYQSAYKRASVNTLDQNKLIIMLYDGAIKSIVIAIEKMKVGDIEQTHKQLVKSKNIVSELMISLNMEKGGEIAKNLKSLYGYMFGQLIEANVNKDPAPAENVLNLLRNLKDAWISISSKNTQKTNMPSYGNNGVNPNKRINLKG